MDELEKLREKLRLVESLYLRPGSEGERSAAEGARSRLQERIEQLESDIEEEYQYSLPDRWSRHLFLAVMRRHGIEPYRYKGQRYTTVMVRASERRLAAILPEFRALNEILVEGLHKITDDLITSTIFANSSDETEVKATPGALPRG